VSSAADAAGFMPNIELLGPQPRPVGLDVGGQAKRRIADWLAGTLSSLSVPIIELALPRHTVKRGLLKTSVNGHKK
jgi:hypothetical protein